MYLCMCMYMYICVLHIIYCILYIIVYFYTLYRQEKARRASEVAKEQAKTRERINGKDFAKVALKDRKHPYSV